MDSSSASYDDDDEAAVELDTQINSSIEKRDIEQPLRSPPLPPPPAPLTLLQSLIQPLPSILEVLPEVRIDHSKLLINPIENDISIRTEILNSIGGKRKQNNIDYVQLNEDIKNNMIDECNIDIDNQKIDINFPKYQGTKISKLSPR